MVLEKKIKPIVKYIEALKNLYSSFNKFNVYDHSWKFSPECAERTVRYFYNDEKLDVKALTKATKKVNSKLSTYLDGGTLEPLVCLQIICPNIQQIVSEGLDTVIENLNKYSDCKMFDEIKKFLTLKKDELNGIYYSVAPVIVSEFEKRIKSGDENALSIFRECARRDLMFANEQAPREWRLLGLAKRISRLASYNDLNDFKPMTYEDWVSFINGYPVAAKAFEGLSPEGAKKELDKHIKLYVSGPQSRYEKSNIYYSGGVIEEHYIRNHSPLVLDCSLLDAYCHGVGTSSEYDFETVYETLLEKFVY